MARKLMPVIILLGIAAVAAIRLAATYNTFVGLDLKVSETWAQVENVLQRRADLIPNLVETVKGYAKHEKDVFIAVTEARAGVDRARTLDEKVAASSQLERALGRLLLVVENYPQLKANENFLRLQDELAGTENRIAVERMRYNKAVTAYNRLAKGFPGRMLVGPFGFERERPYFQAAEGAESPPKVSFE